MFGHKTSRIGSKTLVGLSVAAAVLFCTPLTIFAEEAAEAEQAVEPTSGWKNGFFIQSEDGESKLKVGARVQTRYTYETDGADEPESKSFFSVPRARLSLSGHAFSKDLVYKFQTDFSKGDPNLKDFYLDYAVVPKTFHVRVGQAKRPFSRQFLTSSSKFTFVDRQTTAKDFAVARDIGVTMHNHFGKSPTFEWALGVYNGASVKNRLSGDVDLAMDDAGAVTGASIGKAKQTNSDDFVEPALVARVGYNYGDVKGYSEGDLAGGDFRFGVGLGSITTFDMDEDEDGFSRYTLDFIMKVNHFALSGAYFGEMVQTGAGFESMEASQTGAHVEASMLLMDWFMPALGWGWNAPEDSDGMKQDIGVSLSAFIYKHKVKVQTDFHAIMDDRAGANENVGYLARTQLQFGF